MIPEISGGMIRPMAEAAASRRKCALITGASRGIGRGIALQLAQDGMDIAIHYYQNESAANATLEQVRKRGADGFLVRADVRKMDEVSGLFQTVRARFKTLDVFVANARPEAAEFFQPPMAITLEQWDAAFESQAKAFLISAREASTMMSAGGRIVATAK